MNEFDKKIKYVHLLWGHDLKFTEPLLKTFNDPSSDIDISCHMFVTPYPYIYDCIKKYPNVVLDTSKKSLYKKYYRSDAWIITHGYKSITDFFKLGKKILGRVIFRTWGGAFVYRKKENYSFFYNLKHNFFYFFYKKRISKLAAIGIANYVDEYDIRQFSNRIPLYRLSYTERSRYEYIKNLKNTTKNDNVVKVLVGHRGSRDNNHLGIIEKLRKVKDKIEIYIPLSYGDKNYIHELISTFETSYKDYHINIVQDFFPYEEYSKFLSTMDVAIFDGKDSYALGNIAILLMLDKKLFLSNDSLIAKAFRKKNIPYGAIESMEDLDFDSFSNKFIYEQDNIQPFIINSYEGALNNWKKLFNDFN